jgi:hypothetical protein
VYWLAVMVFASAFCVLYLGSTSRWWFEDDPTHFALAAAVKNPVAIFVDPQVLRHWGTGASLVPMHVLSYWCDIQLFGISPMAARLHNLVSTVLVCWLLYLALTRFGADRACSAFAAGLWLWLPATIAVHYYLGPRHYIEGLGWSLAACCFLYRICHEPPGAPAMRDTAFLVVFTLAAILSKEIYVTTLLAFIVLYSFWHRRYWPGAMAVTLLPGYYWYRIAMLGSSIVYPHPAWSVGEYARSLRVLPYTFAASPSGWLYYGGLAVGAAWAFKREPRSVSRYVILMFVVFAAGLAATYPTAAALLLTYETPGTWYRAAFISCTVAFIAGAYMLGRYANRKIQLASLCIFIAIVVPGMERTRVYWNGRFVRSEAEGRFYLAHPDRLIYSEEDATWFLPGLDRLYGAAGPHYVSKNELTGPHVREMLDRFSTVWRYQDATWVEDRALYVLIQGQNAETPSAVKLSSARPSPRRLFARR